MKVSTSAYRPPQNILDIFWVLADGTDEQRTSGTVKLAKLIKESKVGITRSSHLSKTCNCMGTVRSCS